MEKELKIIPPIGYEIDRQKSTFEKIVFKKIPENPKTWEEYCELTKGIPSFYSTLNGVDTNKYLVEVACDAYCKCCDTKDCEDLGEYNDFNCDWVCKFRKELRKN